MKIRCPHCGQEIRVKGFGRPPLAIPLINVCDAVRRHPSVSLAAEELGCSEAYIFKVLKTNGLKLKDIREAGNGSKDVSLRRPLTDRGKTPAGGLMLYQRALGNRLLEKLRAAIKRKREPGDIIRPEPPNIIGGGI